MRLQYIDESLQSQWEDLTKKNSASGYMQSFWFAQFQQLLGWETYKIGIFDKGDLLGGAVIAKYGHYKNQSILYIPEGPVLPYNTPEAEEMFDLLMTQIDLIADFNGKKPTSHVSIEPKITTLPSFFSRFKKATTDRQPLSTLLMDLTLKEEDLLAQMKPKGRYNIKVAQKNGIKIHRTNPQEGLRNFLTLYVPFVKRSGFDGKDTDYFERLVWALSEGGEGEFFFAQHKDTILATALVIYYGDTATYLFGASSDTQRQTMAPYLLHWEIIKHAKLLGYRFYDWYGVSPVNNSGEHPWDGFSVFKKKFGGAQINYIGAYDFVYNQPLYKEYAKENM